jgi:glutamate carboxypeptidase
MPVRVHDGRASGPGIYDMKTGRALVVEALAWLRSTGGAPRRPVRLLVTCDEEIGAHSSRPLFEQGARETHAALVLEPCLPDGSVKTARKGVSTYSLDVEGRAAHAGVEPEAAVSATRELISLLPAIQSLENPPAGTTINVGILRAGTATNTVPAQAHIAIDVRAVVPEEAARVDTGLRALRPAHPEARYRLVRTEHRGPLVRTPEVQHLYGEARRIAAGLGVELGEGSTGGGSDGSIVAEYGLPVLDGIGAAGGGTHAVDEHIRIDDLPFRLALVTGLLETL